MWPQIRVRSLFSLLIALSLLLSLSPITVAHPAGDPPEAVPVGSSGEGEGDSGASPVSAAAEFAVSVSPSSLNFGTRAVDTRSAAQRLTLTNTGTRNIDWQNNSDGRFGPYWRGFETVAETCTPIVARPGDSCTLDVVFAPRCPGVADTLLEYFVWVTPVVKVASIPLRGTATAPDFCLDVSTKGSGTVSKTPPPNGTNGRYLPGTQVTLVATPQPGSNAIFTGWTINGETAGYDPTLTLTTNKNYTVVANFGVPKSFCDVNQNDLYFEAIRQLSARNVIRGYSAPSDGRLCFGPTDNTLRAQMAALIVRPLGWDLENWGNSFTDGGGLDATLWRNVGTLAHYNVARGYTAADCRAKRRQPPCFGPNDDVLYAQVISFIVRGMVEKGYWQYQPDNASYYPNVPTSSGHRVDIATFVHYVGPLPETVFPTQTWAAWSRPAPRYWFAEAEWRALDSYFTLNHVP